MLDVRNLSARYGQHPALQQVSLSVRPGEIVVILGANGAGKSTLLRAIGGVSEGAVTGEILLDGQPLLGLSPDGIVERGIALVPEGRGIFGDLSVRENLLLGAYSSRARAEEAANLSRVLSLFPKLSERQAQIVRTMSGGEQQMVAIARAVMSSPSILMLDEPSLGLSPILCKELFRSLAKVRSNGVGVLLVEQNARMSLAVADRGYLLENTRMVHEDSATNLARDPAVQAAYLGVGGHKQSRPEGIYDVEPLETPIHRPRQPAQRTAEQLTGLDIEALANAATLAGIGPDAVAGRAVSDKSKDSRIGVVLKDIETAAQAARRRRKPIRFVSERPDANSPADGAGDLGPAPVIEIHRRPRVQVYRRGPDGEFECE